MYDIKFETFEEICDHSKGYINDEHSEHIFFPFNRKGLEKKIKRANGNMYELTNMYTFIKKFLIKYNDLGFLTVCSQPGKIISWDPHENLSDDKFVIKAKAFVSGYMFKNKALKIKKKMRNHPNIHCLIDYCKLPSNKIPILTHSFKNWKMTVPKCLCDGPREHIATNSLTISPFTMDKLKYYLDNEKYFESGEYELVNVLFFDNRYDNNIYLWKTILHYLEN